MHDLLSMLPDGGATVMAYVGVFVSICSALVVFIRATIAPLRWLAAQTEVTWDDDAVSLWTTFADGLEKLVGVFGMFGIGASRAPLPTRSSRASATRSLVVVALLSSVAAPITGCAGGEHIGPARVGVSIVSVAVSATDIVIASAYADLQDDIERGAVDEATSNRRFRRLRRVEVAFAASRSALAALELSIDAYEAGHEGAAADATPCAVAAVGELVAALDAAGLEVPPAVSRVVELATAIVPGSCGSP